MDGICMAVCDVNKLSCNLNALDFSVPSHTTTKKSDKIMKLYFHVAILHLNFFLNFFLIKYVKIKCIFVYMKNALDFVTWIQLHFLYKSLSFCPQFILFIKTFVYILFRTQMEWKTIFREIYLFKKKNCY